MWIACFSGAFVAAIADTASSKLSTGTAGSPAWQTRQWQDDGSAVFVRPQPPKLQKVAKQKSMTPRFRHPGQLHGDALVVAGSFS